MVKELIQKLKQGLKPEETPTLEEHKAKLKQAYIDYRYNRTIKLDELTKILTEPIRKDETRVTQ